MSSASLPILFGANVRRVRVYGKMSQEDLAFKCSLDRTYISGIERGVRNPSLANVEKIAKALKVSPSELVQ